MFSNRVLNYQACMHYCRERDHVSPEFIYILLVWPAMGTSMTCDRKIIEICQKPLL